MVLRTLQSLITFLRKDRGNFLWPGHPEEGAAICREREGGGAGALLVAGGGSGAAVVVPHVMEMING